MAGDEGFEPPIVEPESTALPLGQSPISCFIIPQSWVQVINYRIRLTSGEPVTTSMQTSLQELAPLQLATGNLHPDLREPESTALPLGQTPIFYLSTLVIVDNEV